MKRIVVKLSGGRLPEGLPGLADPGLPAAEMIAEAARFSELEQRDHVAWGWLADIGRAHV